MLPITGLCLKVRMPSTLQEFCETKVRKYRASVGSLHNEMRNMLDEMLKFVRRDAQLARLRRQLARRANGENRDDFVNPRPPSAIHCFRNEHESGCLPALSR